MKYFSSKDILQERKKKSIKRIDSARMRSSARETRYLLRRGELAGTVSLLQPQCIPEITCSFQAGRFYTGTTLLAARAAVPGATPCHSSALRAKAQIQEPGGHPFSPEGCYAGQHQTKTRGQQLQRRALRQRQPFTLESSKHGRLAGEGQEAEDSDPNATGARRAPSALG